MAASGLGRKRRKTIEGLFFFVRADSNNSLELKEKEKSSDSIGKLLENVEQFPGF